MKPAMFPFRTLPELLTDVEVLSVNGTAGLISGVSCCPDLLRPGWLYVAARPTMLESTTRTGPVAATHVAGLVIEQLPAGEPPPANVAVVKVRDVRKAYATICSNFFGHAHRDLALVAVTGTKGKTTTCHLIAAILRKAGFRVGVISSLMRSIGDDRLAAAGSTTPLPEELHYLLVLMRLNGVRHVVIEASSIGIQEQRLAGLKFAGLVFTNLGREHLEYHGGMDAYKRAKSALFSTAARAGAEPVLALNVDDAFGAELARQHSGRARLIRYGFGQADLTACLTHADGSGVGLVVDDALLTSPLLGRHNAYNVLAAAALARGLGVDLEHIRAGIASVRSLPGRFERVTCEGHASTPEVYVDYAHTPESVSAALATARTLLPRRRLIVVVGCGGGSDRGKRPGIGRVAVEESDVCLVTSDNPRQEDPEAIIADMLAEVQVEVLMKAGRLGVITDRREAIVRAIALAGGDGRVLILGRGAESVQRIGPARIQFDDRRVAAEALLDASRDTARLAPCL